MVYCVAWGCTASSNNGKNQHFFRFPSEKTDLDRRKILKDILNDEQTIETNPPNAFDRDRNEPYEIEHVRKLRLFRHVSVKKYMREQHKDKEHYFDVWHVTKGVGKKLEAAAKKPGCAAVRPWIKSTTNHMYWVAASCKDDPDLKVDKWLSVINHVANKHEGHSSKFKQCEHGPLTEERLWLKEGSKPYKAFMEVVSSGYLVRDLPNLSPVYQTFALEVFHSVVNHFAPKNTHYFYAAMMARMFLAALHFNKNGNREQATDQVGNSRWKMMYPKSKKGEEAVVKPVKQQVTFNYAEDLQRAVIERRKALPNYTSARKDADKQFHSTPLPLTKSFKPVVKKDLVTQQKSRFLMPK
ncbi:uncharacterized protein [Haliotis asinina]|uniref:uncharacterized protein n=1 Tax=Haliotis asinina TaxID=109174 RepID=UPI00353265F0